jgi:hypothetical protein
MEIPEGMRALGEVEAQLRRLLSVAPRALPRDRERPVDLAFEAGRYRFFIRWSRATDTAHLLMVIRGLPSFSKEERRVLIPVVAAPYMGEAGRRLCEEEGVGWMDLSGNARLTAEFLQIEILGKPNLFKRPGRPASVFAHRSSRIARWFLMNPGQGILQSDLARRTSMDEGFTSRIVRKLVETEILARDKAGLLRVPEPDALLDSWREAYDFSKHAVIKGHVAERSSDELLINLSKGLEGAGIEHAATGLGGAWLWDQFAMFRIVTFLVGDHPSSRLLEKLHFRAEERGGNAWLVIPKDRAVFEGAKQRKGIRTAHWVQVYLDLKGHPERAAEAAERLLERHAPWGNHARKA